MSIIRFVTFTLGYTNPRKAIWDHTKGVTNRSSLIAGDNQKMTFVPEGGVYRLIAHSGLPPVERFKHQGFGEVLPSIRKTSMYILLATHVGEVAKLIEQTGMKIGSKPFFRFYPKTDFSCTWQRKHSNAEIMNSGLDRRQKGQSYICQTTKSKPHSPPIAAMRFFTVG